MAALPVNGPSPRSSDGRANGRLFARELVGTSQCHPSWLFLAAGNELLPMVVAFVILLSSGCNSARKEAALKQEISHLKPLIILYGQFYARRGSPPANQSQFREFIASHGQSILANIGVTNVDDLFVSERDGQPYVILYARSEPDDPSRDLVAYEQIGLNGKRYVGYSLGQIAELDEVQFRELVRE